MLNFLARFLWVFISPLRVFTTKKIQLTLSIIFLNLYFYLNFIYAAYFKKYFYDPFMKYSAYIFWNYFIFIFVIVIFLYIYKTIIRKYYFPTNFYSINNKSQILNIGTTIEKRNSDNTKKDIKYYVIKNQLDRRFLVQPFGLLPLKKSQLNYLIYINKKNFKIKLVNFFFDMEYAASFNGVFNWWFLNSQIIFNMLSYILILFFFTSYVWFEPDFIFRRILGHLRKRGLYWGSLKVTMMYLLFVKVFFISLIIATINHYGNKSKIFIWDQVYRENQSFLRIFFSEFLMAMASFIIISIFFRKSNKYVYAGTIERLALLKIHKLASIKFDLIHYSKWYKKILKLTLKKGTRIDRILQPFKFSTQVFLNLSTGILNLYGRRFFTKFDFYRVLYAPDVSKYFINEKLPNLKFKYIKSKLKWRINFAETTFNNLQKYYSMPWVYKNKKFIKLIKRASARRFIRKDKKLSRKKKKM